ncbi:MAG: 4-hydroxy-tetrahydrodipicolinate synthase, partial [Patescibacteria group bacterium]|nr:4-hydroxy-tetrahydrodipicolinate synthase [Patescibacteria group bacterium]
MNKYKGAITAIVTPFTKNGAVDIRALKNFVEFQVRGGIDAIVACGSTGEAATMNPEEYSLVIQTVVRQVNGRVPVIAGAGSNDTQKAVMFSRLAKDAGAECLLHVTPYYNKPTLRGLIAHFGEIAKAVDLPIILYNVPGRTGLNLTAVMTLKIAQEIPSIIGIKEATGQMTRLQQILRLTEGHMDVFSGDDPTAASWMLAGAKGNISVTANVAPKLMAKMCDCALDGDHAAS